MFPDEVFVHCSERNASILTLDGVDVKGERLAVEVRELVQRAPNLRKISFVAHSVGGLVARYAIARLYRYTKSENTDNSHCNGCEEESRGTICGLEPMNFIIVYEEHCKAYDAVQCEPTSVDDNECDQLEGELVTGLSRVSWEKVDVSFHCCKQRFAAHSVIQVKDETTHKEGEDIIRHMTDHFLH